MSIFFPERFNMADYFLYYNLEEGRENKTCLYFENNTYTYADAARLANQVGNALRECGVRIEERILIVLPDCPEFVWTWFGAARIGAVITMVNPLLPAEDYKYYLDYTRARVAVIHESLLGSFSEAAASARYLHAVLTVGERESPAGAGRHPNLQARPVENSIQAAALNTQVKWFSFETVVRAQSNECTAADTHRDDIAIWLFTSGSTGHPKGAVHLQHDLPFNTEVFAKRTIGVTENDLTVSVPKLFFGYATGTNLLFPFAVGGATALFSERSTPEKLFAVIERYHPTVLTTVPTMINAMLNAPDARSRDLSSLRFCYSAGEALPVELYERWKKTLGVEIYDGIGSAEMFHIYITNRPGDVKPGSLGKVVAGYEAKIVDAESSEVSSGEMGTLQIRGDSAALCYWNAHEKSKETFAGDWCTTGDQFHVDAEGYYWYHGRTDDMLKVSGIFVAPAEIENCLLKHEAVLECAVIGAEAGDGLVKPKAFVVLREEFAERALRKPDSHEGLEELADELKEFVKTRLAIYKYPRWIEFVSSLPKNDRGKIDRQKLKQA
ncbi:MAG TPA: benzoate-CoA ligase family protein [Blastocatellia bacterium]|jgi:benzoate-CoA ligase family protein|nr:benzoate-CoA ligase family protein [Blastocatellia bacterium]HAF22409.1 benzoate-CoA ligase family protein [Blastocatellia bacterium]